MHSSVRSMATALRSTTSTSQELTTPGCLALSPGEPLGHVGLDEFPDQVAQMSLAENHEVIQALVLDGSDESFRVRIAIWALRWDFHALHAPSFENRDERLREQRSRSWIRYFAPRRNPSTGFCQIASHLHHPRFARGRRRSPRSRRRGLAICCHGLSKPMVDFTAKEADRLQDLMEFLSALHASNSQTEFLRTRYLCSNGSSPSPA